MWYMEEDGNNLAGTCRRGMKLEDYEFFRDNGYLELGQILGDDEVALYATLFERERERHCRFWRYWPTCRTWSGAVRAPGDSCIEGSYGGAR